MIWHIVVATGNAVHMFGALRTRSYNAPSDGLTDDSVEVIDELGTGHVSDH